MDQSETPPTECNEEGGNVDAEFPVLLWVLVIVEKEVEDVDVRCPTKQAHKYHQCWQDRHRQKLELKTYVQIYNYSKFF